MIACGHGKSNDRPRVHERDARPEVVSMRRILRNFALPFSGERCSPGRLPRGPIKDRGPAAVLRTRRHGAGLTRFGPSPESPFSTWKTRFRDHPSLRPHEARYVGEHQLRSSDDLPRRDIAIFSTFDRSRSSGTLSEPSGWIIATTIHIRFLDPVRRPNRGPMPGIFIPESSSRNHDSPQASLRFKPSVACCLSGTEVPSLTRSLRTNSATCDLDVVRTCECPTSSFCTMGGNPPASGADCVPLRTRVGCFPVATGCDRRPLRMRSSRIQP